MSEALLGHEILNHLGVRIRISARTLRRLDMEHFLRRDKATGLLQFKPELIELHRQMGPDHELGSDFSGPNVCECKCKQCQAKSDLSDSRMSDVRVSQIVADVKRKRRENRSSERCHEI